MRGLTFRQNGDNLIPSLTLGESINLPIRKYGRIRCDFSKNHRPTLYHELVLMGKLYAHPRELDTAAEVRLNTITPHLANDVGITETLKLSITPICFR